MKAPNTINRDEYARMLFEACKRMHRRLIRLSDEEASKRHSADNDGNEAKALSHYFNQMALNMAIAAITKAPQELE